MLDEVILAAGAVVWRGDVSSPEILLVHRPKYDDWTLPKGKALAGEPLPQTAVREVREETGLPITLGRPLPAQGYLRGFRPKRVDYWAATVSEPAANGGQPDPSDNLAGSSSPDQALSAGRSRQVDTSTQFIPNHEVDAIEWLRVDRAQDRLTYPRDAEVLAALLEAPTPTAPYIFLRHAYAGLPAAWRGDDAQRPLDETGFEQAATLADVLACYGSARVLSSPTLRCTQTVVPYAARMARPVETTPALAVDAPYQQAVEELRELLSAESPVVLCGHGEGLPALVAWACAALGAAPPIDASLGKGAFWALHVAKGAVVGTEYHQI
jgi:8-oxo-dGTP diphosphatase